MASKVEDDYWNSSARFSFTFDDEVETIKDSLLEISGDNESDSVFHSALEASDTLPLRSIISRKNLDSVLLDVKLPTAPSVAPVADPITTMFHGDFSNLHCYRTLEDKILLLDKAIESYDGNVILKVIMESTVEVWLEMNDVVLFLSKTLKPSIIYRYLTKRPIALQQYSNYLANSNRTHDLELLYTATGNKAYLSSLYYLSSKRAPLSNISKKLSQFTVEYLDNLRDDYEKVIFSNHKKFVQYKLDKGLEGNSPAETLVSIYTTKLEKGNPSDSDVRELVTLMKMSDLQQEWLWLNLLAANSLWLKLTEFFTKSNWFTKKNMIKSNVSMELLVTCLAKHEAPKTVMEDFLASMSDVDRSMYLGRKYKCHKFVVETLASKRDRLGLLEYRSHMPPQSETLYFIDGILCSTDKKWIN